MYCSTLAGAMAADGANSPKVELPLGFGVMTDCSGALALREERRLAVEPASQQCCAGWLHSTGRNADDVVSQRASGALSTDKRGGFRFTDQTHTDGEGPPRAARRTERAPER